MNSDPIASLSTAATVLPQKPQIFINHVDKVISAEMIQAACDTICGPDSSNVALRPSHDNNYKNCSITLTSEENIKKLREIKNLKIGETLLRLDPYQAQYPNLFLRNTANLTQEQLEEGLKEIVKGFFHIYYGKLQVSFFIENEAELSKLISQPLTIAETVCSFQKYIANTNKKEKNCLFIRFALGQMLNLTLEENLKKDFGQIQFFSLDQRQQEQLMVASVTFERAEDAEKLFNQIVENQNTLYNTSVNVQWKKSGDESIEEKLFVKNLKTSSTEQLITAALSELGGEVVNVECQVQYINSTTSLHTAVVLMGSPQQCEDVMIRAHSNLKIKQLFLNNTPYIAPYIPRSDMSALKHNEKRLNQQNNQGRAPQLGQEQAPLMMLPLQAQQQLQLLQQPYNQAANYQYMIPFFQPAQQGKQPTFNNNQFFNQQQQLAFQQQMYLQQTQQHSHQHQSAQNQEKPQQKFRQNQSDRQPRGFNKNNSQKNNNSQTQQQRQAPKQQQHQSQQQKDVANNQLPYQTMSETQMKTLLKTDTQAFSNAVLPSLRNIVKKELSATYPGHVNQSSDIVEMLVDPEIFTQEQVIQLIYNKTEFTSRIQEAIALLEENSTDTAN